jgi:hypothetical protein
LFWVFCAESDEMLWKIAVVGCSMSQFRAFSGDKWKNRKEQWNFDRDFDLLLIPKLFHSVFIQKARKLLESAFHPLKLVIFTSSRPP